VKTLDNVMRNYKDESFILQFLSPTVIRELKLFCALDDDKNEHIEIAAIHNDEGYQEVREILAGQYNLGDREPNIQITDVDIRGDRALFLKHFQHNRKPLAESADEMLKYLHQMWGFNIHLDEVWKDKVCNSFHCPQELELELK